MKVYTRLRVVDGNVLCPHTCDWKSVEECARCSELTRIERGEAGTTVVCAPEIEQPLGSLLRELVRV